MNMEMTFGDWLKRRRRQLDLTQKELANLAGCGLGTLRKIERGTRRPSKDLAAYIGAALNIPEEQMPAFVAFARSDPDREAMSWPDFAQEQTTAAQASLPELVATAAAPEIHHNIPLQPTPFIGRTAEKAALHDFLNNPDSRLITVLGPGGMGKTRLTLAASEPYLTAPTLPSSPLFPDGLFFVDLAPLTDPTQIIPALAKALQFPLQDAKGDERTPQEQVLDFLHEKQSLLILDNCEHLINGTAQLAAMILQSCSEITILASSREAFGMPGEIQFEVPPLSFPDVQPPPSFEECGRYDALHLFVDRATAVLPAFQVTQENFAAVVEICQRLDGIPLAVELAAARVNVLTTAQIAVRLDDRFCLLSRGSRTALPRQQTLRATIDWSWSLLTDSEKLLLGRLSLFAGGMDLEAVEAVCSGDGLDMYHLLDLVSALANKSLIIARREQGQETRYRLLDTIRQYARERLKKTGQSVIYRNQHLNYFLHLGEEAEQALVGSDQVAWMKRMERELDNVRAALSWARETDVEAGLQLISALWRFWLHTYVSEGEAWLEQLLARADMAAPGIKANALAVQGRFNHYLYSSDRARASIEESLVLFRRLGDQRGIALCLTLLGMVLGLPESPALFAESVTLFRGLGDKAGLADALASLGYQMTHQDHQRAKVYLEESESLYREMGHLAGISYILDHSAWLAMRLGEFEQARSMLEESLALQEQLDRRGSSKTLLFLGILYRGMGDYEQARTVLEKGMSESQQAENRFASNWLLVNLGHAAMRMGETAEARATLFKSVERFLEVGDDAVFAVEGLAGLAASLGQAELTVRLYAWADMMRELSQDYRPPFEQAFVDRDIVAVLDKLGEEAYAAAYAQGKAMTMDQAIAYALQIPHPVYP